MKNRRKGVGTSHLSTEGIAKYYLEKASIAPALPGCLPYKLTGTELDKRKNRKAKALHRPRVGGGQTGQLKHDKNREAVPYSDPGRCGLRFTSNPFRTAPISKGPIVPV